MYLYIYRYIYICSQKDKQYALPVITNPPMRPLAD